MTAQSHSMEALATWSSTECRRNLRQLKTVCPDIHFSVHDVSALINAGQSFMKRRTASAAKILMIRNALMIGKQRHWPTEISVKRRGQWLWHRLLNGHWWILSKSKSSEKQVRNLIDLLYSNGFRGFNLPLQLSDFYQIGIRWGLQKKKTWAVGAIIFCNYCPRHYFGKPQLEMRCGCWWWTPSGSSINGPD